MSFDAVVLAGGRSERMGGRDKAELRVGGARLLDLALHAVASADLIAIAGPRRRVSTAVVWVSERPAGGGPVAALGAGLDATRADGVVVLAVDHPFVTAATIDRLRASIGAADAAVVCGEDGVPQPLVGFYRRGPLEDVLRRHERLDSVPVRDVVEVLRTICIRDDLAARDCDTPEELESVRVVAEAASKPNATS